MPHANEELHYTKWHDVLTNSMLPSPWEASSHIASQEILRLLWNPQFLLPYSEQHATGPYSEPDEPSPPLPILFP